MFESIDIHGYRGIANTRIEDFERVNLFFGKNNCGKSTLLEAIFMLTGQSNPTLPVAINSTRGQMGVSEQSLELLFHRPGNCREFTIEASGRENRRLKVRMVRQLSTQIEISKIAGAPNSAPDFAYGLELEYSRGNDEAAYKSSLLIDADNNGHRNISPDYTETIVSRFVSSRLPSQIESELYAEIIKNKEEEEIYEIMRIVEPRLLDIQLVGKDFYVNLGDECRLPVYVMGDGFMKVLELILAIYYSSNGIVVVDEADTGIHFSIMPKLWEAIFTTCRKRSVQLFASTHSLDFIQALVKACHNKTCSSEVAAYKLIRKPADAIAAVRYSGQQLAYSVTQEIEMR
ncbi:MAG: AAA family ATPase [Muribaculaceae bacterium]|nr:AAA family ATPase [Muribaculaceae bacterium]